MPKDKVGVALFGLGWAGEIHLPSLVSNPDVHLKWLVDVAGMQERAQELCRLYDLPQTQFLDTNDCQPVFDDPGTVAVVVAAPTRFHEAIIKRAVAAGKHVFCEKPIAFTADVVKSCYEEAQKYGCVLFCAFNRRFENHHIKLKKTVESHSLGCPRVVHYNARDAKTSTRYVNTYIKNSGGIFCDSAIHQLDYVMWLLGEKPSSLIAMGGCRSEEADNFKAHGDLDHVLITLQFPSQVHAYIQVIRETQRDFPYFRMEIVGTEGTYFSHKVTSDTLATQGLDGSGQEEKCPFDFAYSYKQEMDCFIRVVQGSVDSTINSVDVTPCPQEPCQFARNHTISTTVTFTATKPFTKATNKVYGLILGQKVPFPMAADACQNMPCPAKVGDHVTYKNTVYINPHYPQISVVVQWEVVDQDDKPILCFNVPVQVTG